MKSLGFGKAYVGSGSLGLKGLGTLKSKFSGILVFGV